jgi:hypothetical protein
MRSSVDLPEPEGPISTRISPGSTTSEIGDRRVDARSSLGRRLLEHGRVAAGEHDDLIGAELETIGRLEGGQGGRAFDELR